jgi:hypothetical protein
MKYIESARCRNTAKGAYAKLETEQNKDKEKGKSGNSFQNLLRYTKDPK